MYHKSLGILKRLDYYTVCTLLQKKVKIKGTKDYLNVSTSINTIGKKTHNRRVQDTDEKKKKKNDVIEKE